MRKNETPRRRHRHPNPAVTELMELPLVLRIDEILGVYRCGRSTVLQEVREGTFRPAPFLKHPYRWLREDVQRDLQRRSGGAQAEAARVDRVAARVRKTNSRGKRA